MTDPKLRARLCRIEAARATHRQTKELLLELASEYDAIAGDTGAIHPDDPELQAAVADRLHALAEQLMAWSAGQQQRGRQ
jgi:hypothetical protein